LRSLGGRQVASRWNGRWRALRRRHGASGQLCLGMRLRHRHRASLSFVRRAVVAVVTSVEILERRQSRLQESIRVRRRGLIVHTRGRSIGGSTVRGSERGCCCGSNRTIEKRMMLLLLLLRARKAVPNRFQSIRARGVVLVLAQLFSFSCSRLVVLVVLAVVHVQSF
jgi:hypothetical protein